MPNIAPERLSEAQVEEFIEHGFIRLDGAFSRELAPQGRDELWAAMGLSPDRPESWTQPVVRLGWMSSPPFVAAGHTPRLHRAYDALVGEGRWLRPQGLGTFPVRFPSPEAPGDDGWHVDASYGTEHPDFMEWRVNVRSRGRALLMLFLFSDVGPEDAPTRIRVGSQSGRTPPSRANSCLTAGRACRCGRCPRTATPPRAAARRCWRWARPAPSISLAASHGFRSAELAELRRLVFEHRVLFQEKWDEHFGRSH